jgi:uroporphyrinogen decarboxylase
VKEKENALRIIRFDRPERVVGGAPAHTLCYRGCNHEGYEGGGHECPVGTTWTDVWGTVWRKELEGVMGFPRFHPLSEPANLKTYPWPDPEDERIYGRIYQMKEGFDGADAFLAGSHRETVWEKSYMLIGMEKLMTYFFTEPDFVREVMQRVMDFQLGVAKHYLAAGIEYAALGDDLGTQAGPLLGPQIVNEFLVPEYERLFGLYRRHNVLIGFHSCGKIESVLETFMRLGVDVLNPVQATANDLDLVRSVTQGRMALQGAVSTATIMSGPPHRIVQEVRRRLWQLGREGGYFCGPDQGLPFPQAHVDALHEAIETYGQYPLRPPD